MSELSINTTQNVMINFTAASVGDRIFAFLLDYVIKIAYIIFVFYIFFYTFGISDVIGRMDMWSRMAVIVMFYSPALFYSLILESFLEGQTFGKRILKIKVVKIEGYQASFGDYLMRWLFRIIDVNSNFGVIGLISMIMSEKTQRLGDMTAGTAVITLKNNININHTILEEIGDQYVPIYPLVIKLSDNDVRIVKETYHTAMQNRDLIVLSKLRDKIETVTGIKNQSGNDEDFIKTILKDYNFYTQNM
ncbi:RDD family protein [Flavobacterium sp. '19STA2R22 D10 B1']|uniref:RDD family protein n=1 Tax=Flavobacterium aerium TaxID=3037261 RepID=UPI00278C8E11|nr:RDD family protein [Flavobacterium sp. '19STA2R22 D10 B1']